MSPIIQSPGTEAEKPDLRQNRIRVLISHLSRGGARLHASNAAYSVGEYIALPILMLVSAPFLIARLGLQQYGIWMLVTAIIGSMGNLSAGFGDATVKYVSSHRGRNDMDAVERAMRATLAINLVLGGALCLLIVLAARTLVEHVFKVPQAYYDEATRAIQISGVIVLARSVETVFVGTLRAFERYGPAVRWNVAGRTGVVTSAMVLAALGHGVYSIMLASLVVATTTLILQAYSAARVIRRTVLLPSLNRDGLREIASFGCFSWLQGLAGVVFTYSDRFVVAAFVSMDALAIYTVCVQITQPIHGVFASGFNFLFPHLSARLGSKDVDGVKRVIRRMKWVNIGAATALVLPIVVAGNWFLRVWLGQKFATGFPILALLALSFGLLGAEVVPHYALLAFGRVRLVSATTIIAGVLSLATTLIATSAMGVTGAALGRLMFSAIVAFYFVALRLSLRRLNVVVCCSCGGIALFRGRIPDAAKFAGQDMAQPLSGGALYGCSDCYLQFRWPRLPKDVIHGLYTEAPSALWESDMAHRPDWKLAQKVITQALPKAAVLDVGCFTGAFLAGMPEEYGRFGVELNAGAVSLARQRGVEVLCSDYDELRLHDHRFGAITAFDVLEHVEDPASFISALTEYLEPGGLLLVSTGNTEALSWRFMGSRYWYCHTPEHISFVNRQWAHVTAEHLGLQLQHDHRFTHWDAGPIIRLRQTILNVLFRISPRTIGAMRAVGLSSATRTNLDCVRNAPPVWMTAKDHILLVFRKPAEDAVPASDDVGAVGLGSGKMLANS